MATQWFYQNSLGQEMGPVTASQRRQLAQKGKIHGQSLIKKAEGGYVKAMMIQELSGFWTFGEDSIISPEPMPSNIQLNSQNQSPKVLSSLPEPPNPKPRIEGPSGEHTPVETIESSGEPEQAKKEPIAKKKPWWELLKTDLNKLPGWIGLVLASLILVIKGIQLTRT